MDGIGSATSRSTDDLLRQAAEDAGLEPEKHYQGALGATFDQKQASLEADQHRTNLGVGEKIGAMGVAKLVGAKLTDKLEAAADLAAAGASRFAPALRVASAGTAIFGTVTMAYELLEEGLVRPNAQADALRSAANNDSAVVGLSHTLEMPEAFKVPLARMRPEVATQGGAAMAAQFAGKDKNVVPVLQARADDGLVAARPWAERIAGAKTDADRVAAMKAFQASNVGQHAGQDAAYGLGIAEALWAVGAKGRGELPPVEYDALFNQANARLDASRPPTVVQG